jgi:predicted RNA-binding protein with PUA-like domain
LLRVNDWLLKTEPDEYGYDDLARSGRDRWDGVRNPQALMFMRQMRRGDRALIYHTGKARHIAGVARVVKGPYPDPEADDERLVVVDLAPVKAFASPVALSSIKGDDAFADFLLVRNSRLSVMPVPVPLWDKLCQMGGV